MWDNSKDNGLGSRWPEVRRRCLRRDPVCMICRREPSVEVDHIQHRSSTSRDYSKLRIHDHLQLVQGVCRDCHIKKTTAEATKARRQTYARRNRPAARHPGMIGE